MRTTHHVGDSFAQNVDHLAHETPLSAFVAEVVCTLGASLPRTATSQPPNGGNCTNRGATRRRHAEARLLMVQNPHRQRCDALRKGQRARAGPGAACFPMTPLANGGNCTNRATTRRRHAVVRLLVVQTPHHYRLFALWGVGVVVEASRGSWTVSWDDDRTQEFTLGASSTKTRMQFGYPNFLQRPKTLQFQRCDFNV